MKFNKKILMLTAVALMALTVSPVFANGGYHDYISNLWAGNDHMEAGLVLVDWMDEDLIKVTYETNDCWFIVQTHLAVATSLEDIPQNKQGNPKVGHFEFGDKHDMETLVTYYVDVQPGETLYIAAHAIVYNECQDVCMTAWGQGANAVEFPGSSWALYFTFPPLPPPP